MSEEHESEISASSSESSAESGTSFERTPTNPADFIETADQKSNKPYCEDAADEAGSLNSRDSTDEGSEHRTAGLSTHNESLESKKVPAPRHSSIRQPSSFSIHDTTQVLSPTEPRDVTPQHPTRPDKLRDELDKTGRSRSGARRRLSSQDFDPLDRHPSTDQGQFLLTYEEELVLIRSENVLKYTRYSTEQAKDIIVTLRFFMENQPPLDHRVSQSLDNIQTLSGLLKQMLMIVEPHRADKKMATFVLNELDVFIRSARITLSMLHEDFVFFDITPLPLQRRREKWRKLMLAFQEENPCSLPEHLDLSCRYGSELLANIKAGILSTPESNLLKTRICKMNGFSQASAPDNTSGTKGTESMENGRAMGQDAGSSSTASSQILSTVNKRQRRSKRSRDSLSSDNELGDSSDGEDRNSTASTLAESQATPKGQVNWLWLCQTDIMPGYWATPWKSLFSEAVCIGSISVFLKVLESTADPNNWAYVGAQPRF